MKKLKVLIIEDEESFRSALSEFLTNWGYEVEQAADAEAGWDLFVATNESCIILLDYILPGASGLDLCQRIKDAHREAEGGVYAHTILITGAEDEDLLSRAIEVGINDHIEKPRGNMARFTKDLEFKLKTGTAAIELHTRCLLDEVTGIWGRKAITDRLEAELDRAGREGMTLALLMIDIDHFKKVNDQHGHQVGDLVLKRVASGIKRKLRRYDLLGRWGGEEFLVVLIDCDENYASAKAESIRASVESTVIRRRTKPKTLHIQVTVSMGIVVWYPQVEIENNWTVKKTVECADKALYQAKAGGRNLVVKSVCT